MKTGTADELRRDGFVPYTLLRAGVPVQIWQVNLDVLTRRGLALGDRTLLRLVAAGLSERKLIAELMGLANEPVFADIFDRLIGDDAIYVEQAGLSLSPVGQLMLANATRDQHETLENRQLIYDPFDDKLRWRRDEVSASQLRQLDAVALNLDVQLSSEAIEERLPDVQALLTGGLPSESTEMAPNRMAVAIRPLTSDVLYDAIQLQLWFDPAEHAWAFIVMNGGEPDLRYTEAIIQLEREDVSLLPLTHKPNAPYAPQGKLIQDYLQKGLLQRQATCLHDFEVRERQREVILGAEEELFLALPWWRDGEIDNELTGWIEEKVQSSHTPRIVIAFSRTYGRTDSEVQRKQDAMLRSLRRLEEKSRKRLTVGEIYELAGHTAVVSEKRAVVTTVEFTPFSPESEPGIPRKVGWEITDPTFVKDLRQRLKDIDLN